jgi:phosphatidate phosphatase APP1
MSTAAPPRLHRYFAVASGRMVQAARLGLARRQLMLLPYLGYGNASTIWLRGRVLDERLFREQAPGDSGWRNAAALYRRLESDEVAGATVLACIGDQQWTASTDSGGYFAFELPLAAPPPAGWLTVRLALPASNPPLHADGQALVPDRGARFGIISDLDDTVIFSDVIHKLRMAWLLARSNHHTRQPLQGVAAWYRALHAGINPLFYVSSSPWHLHDALREFLRLRDLPAGPLLLRELGLPQLLNLGGHAGHKEEKIERLFAAYPGLPFVLIGDSGERDPEIYAALARRHPGAVRMIYIRQANPDPARVKAVAALAAQLNEQLREQGVTMVCVIDSAQAARHAAGAGLIDGAAVDAVSAAMRAASA